MPNHSDFETWLNSLSNREFEDVQQYLHQVADAMGLRYICGEHIAHADQDTIDATAAELLTDIDI